MENPIIVPFDLNTARKIKSGEIEGSVLINKVIIHHFISKMKNNIHLYEVSYWVSPIPSTGCSKVRSPDSFTKQNVFDFTHLTFSRWNLISKTSFAQPSCPKQGT